MFLQEQESYKLKQKNKIKRIYMSEQFEMIAKTFQGLEEILAEELTALGANDIQIGRRMVSFTGDKRMMYKANFCLRTAIRILKPIKNFTAKDADEVYNQIQTIPWEEYLDVNKTFAIDAVVFSEEFRHSKFVSYKVKDAIVDYFREKTGKRPSVRINNPDVLLNIHIAQTTCTLSLDSSGESLHRRGYRQEAVEAPLNEVLAAGMILKTGWKGESNFVDPMCGSGTLLIEAAMLATDRAPGLHRGRWGFSGWVQHDEDIWQEVKAEAQTRARKGLAEYSSHFYGSDSDARVIQRARTNARLAGIGELITFEVKDVAQLTNPLPKGPYGTVLSNPPYGERLDSEPALIALHSLLGRIMKNQFGGWNLSLFSASPDLLSCLQLRADKQYKAKNGPLDCVQKNYPVAESTPDSKPAMVAEDYANRLRKNLKKFEKWARQEGIECYRLYDADLPEYNVAVDRYADWVVVQEYAPPKTIDTHKARQRLFDIIAATISVLGIAPNKLVLKTRERQKGKNQYQKLGEKGEFLEVTEYNAHLLVNLTDYLDTGLFLDHRIARRMLGQMSKGKDFLNLFSYTGSATVHAGLGGARSTTTVDMSRTYLEWAERNLRLNGLTGRAHRLIQADCLAWLREANEQFDLIFIDPPTFSNSKRMEDAFDVQRDHLALMKDLKRLLRAGGTIMFSNNKRGFRMDLDGLAKLGLKAQEITQKTLSQDFARNRQIHNCWLITAA